MLTSSISRTSSLPFWECRANEPEGHYLALGLSQLGRNHAHLDLNDDHPVSRRSSDSVMGVIFGVSGDCKKLLNLAHVIYPTGGGCIYSPP